MLKSIGMLATSGLIVLVAVWLLTREQVSSPDAQVDARETAASNPEFAHDSVVEAEPQNRPDSAETVSKVADTIIRARLTEYPSLAELEEAALGGSTKAQFRLSRAMRYCTVILSYSEDGIERVTDSFRREYLRDSWTQCQHFRPRRDQLMEAAETWRLQAVQGNDPAAKAMETVAQVTEGKVDRQRAREALREMLESKDPYVFWAISLLSVDESGETSESAAWRMLACESAGPPELCTVMNGDIAAICSGERCENSASEPTMDDYYLHARPELFDVARGRLTELKDRLRRARYEDIDLHLASAPTN